ncbi:hypothetical protein GF377_06445 [candidate division GN15 bacterium]|nr:hypothetical protein [candidate division GN15 bacterium]
MRLSLITILTSALLLLLALTGCEREVIVEEGDSFELASCFTCHSDEDMALVQAREQYEESIHTSGNNVDRNRNNRSFYAACEKCHSAEGFLAEVTGVPATGEHFTAIHCFTCHAPHSEGDLGLRTVAAVSLADGTTYDRGLSNICANCHQSRRDVDATVVDGVELSSHWGPHHSNQADMLIGENSYEYDGYTYTKSAHASVVLDGCVQCHMGNSVHPTVGGHSFNMRNEDRDFESISGCNVTGCHSAAPITTLDRTADQDWDNDGETEGIQAEVHGLLDSLAVLLETAGLLDTAHHPVDGRVVSTADSAGALYNYLFVEEDRSDGVHNTSYALDLLISSINFMNTGNPNGSPAALITEKKMVVTH